jgi:hypothetical protein
MIHIEDIREGMEVLGACETLIGVVDSIEGEHIVLVVAAPEGERFRVPLSWVEAVGGVVRLHLSAREVHQSCRKHAQEPPIRHPLAEEADQGPGTV